jgi:hypothetical protein
LPKDKSSPCVENSPNLVTLIARHFHSRLADSEAGQFLNTENAPNFERYVIKVDFKDHCISHVTHQGDQMSL